MADVTTTFAAKDESFAATVDGLQKRLEAFSGNIASFNDRFTNLSQTFSNVASAAIGFGVALFGVQQGWQTFADAIRAGGALDDLSQRTSESVGNLAILQRAFENAGSSAEAVGPMIGRLQRFIVEAGDASSQQATLLNALGISFQDLASKTPMEQMRTLAEAIAEIEDPMMRATAAQLVFGKSGGELIPFLRNFGIELETAKAQLGSYPEALNQSSKALNDIGDNFQAIANKGREFATGLLVEVAPGLAAVTAQIAQIDAARLGMILSGYLADFLKAADGALGFTRTLESVKIAISALASGDISQGLSLLFVDAKIQALTLVNEFVKSFVAGLQAIGGFFSEMFRGDGALAHMMSTLFGAMGDIMKGRLFTAMSQITEQFAFFGDEITKAFQIQAETAANSYKMAMFGIGAQVDLVGEQLAKAGAAMPEAFEANRSKLQPLFDLTDETAQRDQLEAEILAKQQQGADAASQTAENYATASSNATELGNKVANAKGDLTLAADLYTGPNGVAASAKDAADKTNEASRNTMSAFDRVSTSGKTLEDSVSKAAVGFGRSVLESGRLFQQEIVKALKNISTSDRGLATEATLKQAVSALQSLERKLPQPVLI